MQLKHIETAIYYVCGFKFVSHITYMLFYSFSPHILTNIFQAGCTTYFIDFPVCFQGYTYYGPWTLPSLDIDSRLVSHLSQRMCNTILDAKLCLLYKMGIEKVVTKGKTPSFSSNNVRLSENDGFIQSNEV